MKRLWKPLLLSLVLYPSVLLAQQAQVTLTWDPPVPATGVLGYVMERKVATDAWIEGGRPKAPPYTESVSLERQPLCWRVRALSSLGPSNPSNELCLQVPGAPTNLLLTVTIQLSPMPQATSVPQAMPMPQVSPTPQGPVNPPDMPHMNPPDMPNRHP